jgi:hypothetical protein
MGDEPRGDGDFTIIFNELDRISKEPNVLLTNEDIMENEEIRILREIVIEIQAPKMLYYTGT